MKTVSVVIPCRNEREYISKCLDSFINQTYDKRYYEVLVCDGMSTDGTREIVKEYVKKYSFIKLINNEGLTAPKAMNIGIKNSKADILIIFSAHAFAKEDFIEQNVKLLDNKEIGCVGGPIETINNDKKGKAISLAMSSPFGVGNALFRYSTQERFVDTVPFAAYRREVLDEVGYFDEELVRNQDDEINLRVSKAGYKILLSLKIKSWYYARSSYRKLWKQYFQYGFWKVRVMQKHGKPASLRHLVPLIFILVNILGIIFGLINKIIFYLWFFQALLYLVCDIFFSVRVSKNDRGLIKYVIPTFPILHIGYGLGFLEGLFVFYILKSKRIMEKNTKLSR
ncbi:glycosyltransferase family 2 protein [Thermobrachium celere]|uniref:Succinoglycan biosynthesis protein exoA n=1 Tax=Thermobrachium celere DSM 8682 TaxID=941824 RepID=R7RR21_9CLOT|nr:glycosyltransferase family 2 protein [Thermobrachium celere]CDF57748.1 succinoglycan biosynthesis protein exoA [Thermobrachium celere DSM 8682]